MVSPAFRKASKSSRRSSASSLIISAKFSRKAVPMSGILPKRSRLDHCFWRVFRFDCQARTAHAGLLAHGTPCFTTQRRGNPTCRSCISPRNKHAFAFTTVRFQRVRSSGSIMGTPSIIRRCFACGKRNLGISPMARRPLSINSSCQRNPNGSGRVGLCYCFRMAMKVRAPNIPERDFIKPLIIMTPKSLLRASFASSPAEEFIHGRFEEILGSPEATPADRVKRIIFCSGKVYYDLLNYRTQRKIDDAAIIRVEQLYPLAEKKLREMLKPFSKNAKLVWCQEEPENMGAWTFIESRLRTILCSEIAYAGREASASPAVGALARHNREQARLVADAFAV